MNNDLKELLQSVIREEMDPIRQQLDRMENEQQLIKRAVLETNELCNLLRRNNS